MTGTRMPPVLVTGATGRVGRVGGPAYVTSTVSDILGSAPRTFRQWVADHAAAFMESPHARER
jgi:hypothetical protein